MKRIFIVLFLLACVVVDPSKIIAINSTKLGLHVGTINTGSKAEADLIISTLVNMGVKSVRLVYQSPATLNTTVYVIKELNNRGIDVLVTVMPDMSDYSDIKNAYSNYPNGSDEFEQLCGSPGWRWMFKYSTIDQGMYKIRLETLLGEINKVGGKVLAFEIGNETDWACFNGDIPVIKTGDVNRPYDLTQTDYLSDTVVGYANTLKTSYESIKRLQPEAQVLTFGAANVYLFDPLKPHLFYPNFLLWLTDLNGINYLTTYSDATAMHFYPQKISTTEIANIVGLAFSNVAKYRNKFWITEFGFGKSLPQYNVDPNEVETLRLATYQNFLAAINGLIGIVVDRVYLYSFEQNDWSIMSSNLVPLKSALIFKQYNVQNKAGDYNTDGKVDLIDFGIWKTEYLAGRSSLVDFGVWKSAYLQ